MTYLFKLILLCFFLIASSVYLMKWSSNYIGFRPGSLNIKSIQYAELVVVYAQKFPDQKTITKAYYAEIKNDFQVFDFVNPDFTLVSPQDGSMTARRAKFLKEKNELVLTGSIVAKYKNFETKCEAAIYLLKKEFLVCNENVVSTAIDEKTKDTVIINSEKSNGDFKTKYSLYEGNIRGEIIRKLPLEPKTNFFSDSMEFEGLNSKIFLHDNVRVIHKDFDVKSREAMIELENYNKDVKYFTFENDVFLEQKIKEPPYLRKAYAEKMVGIRSEGKAILTGAPRVVQGRDIVQGNMITLRQGASLIEVNDAVSSIIYGDR